MSDQAPEQLSFEQALAALEEIVRDLEDSGMGLEESLLRYERGVSLIKKCYTQLREAEQRILLVTGADSEGALALQPFQHEATEAEAGEVKRAVLRKKGNDSSVPF